MKLKPLMIFAAVSVFALTGCAGGSTEVVSAETESIDMSASSEQASSYEQISQDEAMRMMEEETGYVILDVRTPEEYAEGHIPEAINIPNETIGNDVTDVLTDKDQIILVYCRSGNRSKQASAKLGMMGYSNVYEFGGINTWPGEVVSEEEDSTAAGRLQIEKDSTVAERLQIEEDSTAAKRLQIEVNGQTLSATLEDNSSAKALVDLIGEDGLTLELHDYSGFEKVGDLPETLPVNDEDLDTNAGDLILYQGNQFVLYYDHNSWSLTKLGHVDDISKEDLQALLGDGDVTVTLGIQ